jgi:hypothetical protein
VPETGEVEFKVTQVLSAAHFYIKISRFRPLKGQEEVFRVRHD